MFEELLALNARAAAGGNYEAAYHLLMAALHCVDHDGGPPGALERLVAVARGQGAALEAVVPPHHLSRKQAHIRGQTALYDSFLAHVEAVRLRMEGERQRRHRPA